MRVRTNGSWTADIPERLTRIDNGDSWQAHDERIVVYVSSLSIPDQFALEGHVAVVGHGVGGDAVIELRHHLADRAQTEPRVSVVAPSPAYGS